MVAVALLVNLWHRGMSRFGRVSIGRCSITIGIETVGMVPVDIPIDNTVCGGSVAMVVVLVGREIRLDRAVSIIISWSRSGVAIVVGIVPIGMLSIGMVPTAIVDIVGLLLDASVILIFLLIVDLMILLLLEPIPFPAVCIVSGFTSGRR